MFPDTLTATCHINHIVSGPGFTRLVKVAPVRDGTIETLLLPGQKLIPHTPFLHYEPPHEESGPSQRPAGPLSSYEQS